MKSKSDTYATQNWKFKEFQFLFIFLKFTLNQLFIGLSEEQNHLFD